MVRKIDYYISKKLRKKRQEWQRIVYVLLFMENIMHVYGKHYCETNSLLLFTDWQCKLSWSADGHSGESFLYFVMKSLVFNC